MPVLRDISFLWSMFHVILIFLLFFEPRYSWRTTFLAGLAGGGTLLVVNVMAMFWFGHGIIMNIAFFTCTIPTLILFFILSRFRDGRFFFLFCLCDTSCFWLLQLTNFLDRLAGDTYVVLLISRLLLFPVTELLIWRYLRAPYLVLQRELGHGWWLFAAIGATYYLLMLFTSVPVDTPMPGPAGLARIFLVLLLMPLTYTTILHSLWGQMKFYENLRQMDLQRRDYNTLRQKMELGRLYRHDMRHHLLALEGMLQKQDSSTALAYIQELDGRMSSLVQRDWCEHAAVNSVLAAYLAQAEEAGLATEAQVRLPAQVPHSEMDLCIVLSNALENAILACREIPEGPRQIRLSLSLTENQRLTIEVENSCPTPVEFGADGLPLRSTREKSPFSEEHGLGLRSVKAIVEQCGGLLRCSWEEGTFTFRAVLFPAPQPSPGRQAARLKPWGQ
ncbi:MAG: GHKL domain-containing protein [Oscillospiraceae bacterium]|jgi:signal transduction histidine kinase|nr:GHKL domain-containing protein [Oscillospiraceae bacterium]